MGSAVGTAVGAGVAVAVAVGSGVSAAGSGALAQAAKLNRKRRVESIAIVRFIRKLFSFSFE